MKKITISLLLLTLLTACASQKPKEVTEAKSTAASTEQTSGTTSAATPKDNGSTDTGMGASTGSGMGNAPSASHETNGSGQSSPPPAKTVDALDDPNSILAKRSVYYPFDVSVVQDADKPIVQAHARYLSEHASRKVRLEGNCDERGSDEYNLALGQRRADGVKKMLLVGGANTSQIETVSYGEEKPKLTCHEEKCWKENRRTDMNYNAR